MALNEREQRWFDALQKHINFWGDEFDLEAIIAVADDEQAELRAIVKAQGQNVSPMAYHDAVARGEALQRRALAAEAKVARVETLLAHLHTDTVYAGDIRAALTTTSSGSAESSR